MGYSYESVMSRFLQDRCECVEIDDPYIRSHHQVIKLSPMYYSDVYLAKDYKIYVCLCHGSKFLC